jgi:hypothetical protein
MCLVGMSILEYESARLVKKVNMLCAGLRKLNCEGRGKLAKSERSHALHVPERSCAPCSSGR